MSAKMGRPKLDNPNSIKLSIRISENLNKELELFCSKNGVSRGEVVRKGLEKILAENKK